MLLRLSLFVIGVVFFVWNVRLHLVSNMNVGLALSDLFALYLISYGVFYEAYQRFFRRTVGRVCKWIMLSGIVLALGLSIFIYAYGTQDNVTYQEDALIVLGGGIKEGRVTAPLKNRLDATVRYMEKNPSVFIIVSGGKSYGEAVSEGQAMKAYLVERGISAGKIIEEEQATSTTENFKYSKRILDEQLGDAYSTAFVTNDFHVFRSTRLAKIQGLEVNHLHTSIPWYTIPNNYIRECLAIMKWLVLGY